MRFYSQVGQIQTDFLEEPCNHFERLVQINFTGVRGVSIAKESSTSASVQVGQELLLDCDFSFDNEEVDKLIIIKKNLGGEVILPKPKFR